MKKKVEINPNVSAKFVAQELKFIKRVAGNDSRLSEKELKKLGKWLQLRSNSSNTITDEDALHLWNGLFFCMWLSDKPFTQEKLAENLAALLHCFDKEDASIQFYGAFLQTMGKEWLGIDQWRIDKFMMLVRRVTRQCFVVLHKRKWDKILIKQLNEYIGRTIMDKSSATGFLMHITEIFLEEIAKVANGKISKSKVTLLIQPFMMCVAIERDPRSVAHTIRNIFDALLYQSDLGRTYSEKFEAWKSIGFPGASMHNFTSQDTADSDEDEETITTPLDPHAGRVDVTVPEIPFDPEDVIKKLEHFKHRPYTTVRSRKMIRKIIDRYSAFAMGKFPLGIQCMKINEQRIDMRNIEEKVQEEIDFKKNLHEPTKDLKKLNKKKRKKTFSNLEVPAKKIKLSKVEDTKLKKKKLVNSWVETDITPEEVFNNMSTSGQENCNGSHTIPQTENLINCTTVPCTGIDDRLDSSLQNSNEESLNADNIQPKHYLNPERKGKVRATSTPTSSKFSPTTPVSSGKKVRIMLQLNRSQDTSEYIQQLKTPRKIPFDSAKKPGKGLLKPCLEPSPIDPKYKKKIGLSI